MDVVLPAHLQTKLSHMAEQQGRDSVALITEAVERLVSYDEWFRSEVRDGLSHIAEGHTLSHAETGRRLESYLAAKQQPA